MPSKSVKKRDRPRSQRFVRLIGTLFDPRSWAHGIKILNYYNGTHASPLRAVTRGKGVRISPTASFSNGENIVLEDRCRISAGCNLWAGHDEARIVIGRDTMLAPNVMITAANYRFNDGAPIHAQLMAEADIVIGADVWIGAGVTILAGSAIGDGAVIGAGAVIRGAVAPFSIISAAAASVTVGRRVLPGGIVDLGAEGNPVVASIVAAETPKILPSQRASPLDAADIDSFDLMTLRIAIETATGLRVSDAEWAGLTCLDDIARLPSLESAELRLPTAKTPQTAPGTLAAVATSPEPLPSNSDLTDPPPPPPRIPKDRVTNVTHELPPGVPASMVDHRSPGHLHRRHILEMQKMALSGMGEPWLFRELNDLHWALVCDFLQRPSSQVADDRGDRLYATITRVMIDFSPSLFHFKENTPLDIRSHLERYGAGVFFSQNAFQGASGMAGHATVMSTFAKYGERGKNTTLVKGNPPLPIPEAVPSMEKISDFGYAYRARRAEPPHESVLFETEYEIQGPHDINGVGLLYFAAYPIIYDLCLERFEGKGFLMSHATRSKDLFYFANSEPSETLIFRLHVREKLGDGSIRHICSLSRKSDGARMSEVTSVKLPIT